MVRGLFPQCEREAVLEVLGRSVVFLTPSNQPLLQDRTPADLLQQGHVDEVLAVVNQLLDGVHL